MNHGRSPSKSLENFVNGGSCHSTYPQPAPFCAIFPTDMNRRGKREHEEENFRKDRTQACHHFWVGLLARKKKNGPDCHPICPGPGPGPPREKEGNSTHESNPSFRPRRPGSLLRRRHIFVAASTSDNRRRPSLGASGMLSTPSSSTIWSAPADPGILSIWRGPPEPISRDSATSCWRPSARQPDEGARDRQTNKEEEIHRRLLEQLPSFEPFQGDPELQE
jgi:hypothetical protein